MVASTPVFVTTLRPVVTGVLQSKRLLYNLRVTGVLLSKRLLHLRP